VKVKRVKRDQEEEAFSEEEVKGNLVIAVTISGTWRLIAR
jgi:hypothetical protein